MTIEKLGCNFTIPAKDAIDSLSGYSVRDGKECRRVLSEKVFLYTGNLLSIGTESGTAYRCTPDHVSVIMTDNGKYAEIESKNLHTGMRLMKGGMPVLITSISEIPVKEEKMYDFEFDAGTAPQTSTGRLERVEYADHTEGYILEEQK